MNTDVQASNDADKTQTQLEHDELVADELGKRKVKFFGIAEPNRPPAILGETDKEAIWWEDIEDESLVKCIAQRSSIFEVENKDLAVRVIFDDFTEFFFPIDSTGSQGDKIYKRLEDDYKEDVSKYNDEFDYNKDVKNIDVGADTDKEQADIVALLEEDGEEEDDELDLDIDW